VLLASVADGAVEGVIVGERPATGEPPVAITLYQALLPREKFEQVLQKGTEVGVAAFVPVRTERCLVGRLDAVDERRLARWRAIVREAAEQAGRGRLPRVHPPLPLASALQAARTADLRLCAWEEERGQTLRAALRAWAGAGAPQCDRGRAGDPAGAGGAPRPATDGPGWSGAARVALFVGPEGGLTAAEAEAARAAGALTVSLGPRILRAETAGPVLAALVLYELGGER
jgi:16S rRNA (uracil1498-N3)-methyltransferase